MASVLKKVWCEVQKVRSARDALGTSWRRECSQNGQISRSPRKRGLKPATGVWTFSEVRKKSPPRLGGVPFARFLANGGVVDPICFAPIRTTPSAPKEREH